MIGHATSALKDHDLAIRAYEDSLALMRDLDDGLGVAGVLEELGRAYWYGGRPSRAVASVRESLAIRESLLPPQDPTVVRSVRELGKVLWVAGQYPESLEVNERALSILERSSDRNDQELAETLADIGRALVRAGKCRESLQKFDRALRILRSQARPDARQIALVMGDAGTAHVCTRRYSAALQVTQEALDLLESQQPRDERAIAGTKTNLGTIHLDLGNVAMAGRLQSESLEVFMRLDGEPGSMDVAIGLHNLAFVRFKEGDGAEARSLLERSLTILRDRFGNDSLHVAEVLGNLVAMRLDEKSQVDTARTSLEIFQKALPPDHPRVADAMHSLGVLLFRERVYPEAQELFQQSLELLQLTEDGRRALFRPMASLAALFAAQGDIEAAVFWAKLSVNQVQELVDGNRSLDLPLFRGLRDNYAWVYNNLADLLLHQGRFLEADQVLDLQKEREFYDDIGRNGEVSGRVGYTIPEQTKVRQYLDLTQRQRELAGELRLLESIAPRARSDAQKEAIDRRRQEFSVGLESMRRLLASLQSDLQREYKARQNVDTKAEQWQLQRIVQAANSRPAAARAGERIAAVQYVLTNDRLSVVLTLPDAQEPFVVPVRIAYKELRQRALQFHSDVRSPNTPDESRTELSGVYDNARYFYEVLIRPIEQGLQQAKVDTLVLSLTDVLRYIPMAALRGAPGAHGPERFLIEDYALVVFNRQAQRDKSDLGWLLQAPRQTSKVAAMGWDEGSGTLKPLPAVRSELTAVTGYTSGSDQWLNAAFTLRQMDANVRGGFDVLHLATHFHLNPHEPAASMLYLGDRSTLTLGQLARDKQLQFGKLELVTLSACQTAATSEASGSEVESLAAVVQRLHAPSVLATLWQVADSSTARLMERFYENYLGKRLSKAKALQVAQLSMLRGVSPGAAPKWRAPYYWAAFTLMGNWQ
jgi:CHAT domain-containing protein